MPHQHSSNNFKNKPRPKSNPDKAQTNLHTRKRHTTQPHHPHPALRSEQSRIYTECKTRRISLWGEIARIAFEIEMSKRRQISGGRCSLFDRSNKTFGRGWENTQRGGFLIITSLDIYIAFSISTPSVTFVREDFCENQYRRRCISACFIVMRWLWVIFGFVDLQRFTLGVLWIVWF